jgi:hypothetical protein
VLIDSCVPRFERAPIVCTIDANAVSLDCARLRMLPLTTRLYWPNVIDPSRSIFFALREIRSNAWVASFAPRDGPSCSSVATPRIERCTSV